MTFFDPTKTNIPFIQYRKILISISVVLIAASIALLATKGLNFGVDFTGGLVLQVEFEKPVDVGDVRAALARGAREDRPRQRDDTGLRRKGDTAALPGPGRRGAQGRARGAHLRHRAV